MSDLISRQAAITAIQKAYADTEGGTDKCAVWKNVGLTNALHIMQDLPSAQPEIIHCRDCAKSESDSLFQDIWCDGKKVTAEHYCGYAERREE